jgi:hypothetical protein
VAIELPNSPKGKRLILPNHIEMEKAPGDAAKLKAQNAGLQVSAIPPGQQTGFTKITDNCHQYICDGANNEKARGGHGFLTKVQGQWHWNAIGIRHGEGVEPGTPNGLEHAKKHIVDVCYGKEGKV